MIILEYYTFSRFRCSEITSIVSDTMTECVFIFYITAGNIEIINTKFYKQNVNFRKI